VLLTKAGDHSPLCQPGDYWLVCFVCEILILRFALTKWMKMAERIDDPRFDDELVLVEQWMKRHSMGRRELVETEWEDCMFQLQ
jgi:hypothetical protein